MSNIRSPDSNNSGSKWTSRFAKTVVKQLREANGEVGEDEGDVQRGRGARVGAGSEGKGKKQTGGGDAEDATAKEKAAAAAAAARMATREAARRGAAARAKMGSKPSTAATTK